MPPRVLNLKIVLNPLSPQKVGQSPFLRTNAPLVFDEEQTSLLCKDSVQLLQGLPRLSSWPLDLQSGIKSQHM